MDIMMSLEVQRRLVQPDVEKIMQSSNFLQVCPLSHQYPHALATWLRTASSLVVILFLCRQNASGRLVYYAALLPRRRPHYASHSVCPSVYPSVPLSLPSVTSRHLANYNATHALFGTYGHLGRTDSCFYSITSKTRKWIQGRFVQFKKR